MDLKTWDLMKLDELDVLDEIEFPLIHLSWLFFVWKNVVVVVVVAVLTFSLGR